ncbi:MAG: iron ABC transporter substrate-binding protein [Desulfobacteraceae bacterium]|jgi:iron complex transport system substrate-binding protein|nr:iron ABC transporter substrate-binding protein [Desulfobacteraceae bacterium]
MLKRFVSRNFRISLLSCLIIFFGFMQIPVIFAQDTPEQKHPITDAMGNVFKVAAPVDHMICSGPGCLRLTTYLEAQDKVIAVDDMEKRETATDPRPYAMANPEFKALPLFGEFRGNDNLELIAALNPQPMVIFKTFTTMGLNPAELQQKTGIPVIALAYGDLSNYRNDLYQSLRTMGTVLGKSGRAEAVINFFESTIADLKRRVASVCQAQKATCYVGGIAFKGPHGFQSTEPTYPPFMFVQAKNVAYQPGKAYGALSHATIAKEKIIDWDPQVIFLDLSSIAFASEFNALIELKNDPAYGCLQAVRSGKVYGVMPYNWYAQNFGASLANAYYTGKILYPDQFSDICAEKKADEIFTFLVGAPVFEQIDRTFDGMVFDKVLE